METFLNKLAELSPISLEEMNGISLMNRIDTKFITSFDMVPHILARAAGNYYIQQSVEDKGLAGYNTLYYDTPGHGMYIMHHNRRARRQKIRAREYADTHDIFIEVKNKNNQGRTKKKRVPIPIEVFNNVLENEKARNFLSEKSIFPIESLSPALETSFQRMTLVNYAKTERVTMDIGLTFANRRTGVSAKIPDLVILELKRNGRVHSGMLDILGELRIHPRKISKNCIGIALTDSAIKQNRFKSKIHNIRKLSNVEIMEVRRDEGPPA